MKCICKAAADDLDFADIDFFTAGSLTPSECFSSKTESRGGAIPCNGELIFEPRNDRTLSYESIGVNATAFKELVAFQQERIFSFGPQRSLVATIFSYVQREGFTEWPGLTKWPFVTFGLDSSAEKNANAVPASLNSVSPWLFASDNPTIAGQDAPQLGLCVLLDGQAYCPSKQNANMTKVVWNLEAEKVDGTFADGRRWEPMSIGECIVSCQATPEGTAYIGDGPNGLVV
jgi:hypothetical protein